MQDEDLHVGGAAHSKHVRFRTSAGCSPRALQVYLKHGNALERLAAV